MNTPERNALTEKLIELRTVVREAEKLAQEDGNAYDVIVSLDPVVNGAHEALQHLGLGFMEYPSNDERMHHYQRGRASITGLMLE